MQKGKSYQSKKEERKQDKLNRKMTKVKELLRESRQNATDDNK